MSRASTARACSALRRVWATYQTADERDWVVTGTSDDDGSSDVLVVRPDEPGAQSVDVDAWLATYANERAQIDQALWIATVEDAEAQAEEAEERRADYHRESLRGAW